jgi:hypothetical protein
MHIRDSLMAGNLIWLVDSVFGNENYILFHPADILDDSQAN